MKLKLGLWFILAVFIPIILNIAVQKLTDASESQAMWLNIFTGLLVAGIFALAVAGLLTRELRALAQVGSQVAEGDISKEVDVRTRDEVGQLAESLRVMVNNLREIVRQVQSSTAAMYDAVQNLSVSTSEVTASSTEVAGNVQNIARGAESQAKSVEQLAGLSQRVSVSAAAVAQQSQNTEEQAVESERQSRGGTEAATQASRAMEVILSHVEETASQVKTFKEHSQEINILVESITTVSH